MAEPIGIKLTRCTVDLLERITHTLTCCAANLEPIIREYFSNNQRRQLILTIRAAIRETERSATDKTEAVDVPSSMSAVDLERLARKSMIVNVELPVELATKLLKMLSALLGTVSFYGKAPLSEWGYMVMYLADALGVATGLSEMVEQHARQYIAENGDYTIW